MFLRGQLSRSLQCWRQDFGGNFGKNLRFKANLRHLIAEHPVEGLDY